jgi:UDP-N-acetylmuramate dehydrogenase
MREYYEELKKYGKVKLKESLTKNTTFKVGGIAHFFIEVTEEEKLISLLNFLNSEDIPYFVLGGGSNVLFSDEGFEGVVIKLQTSELKLREDNEIVVAAGVLLNKVVNFALQNKLSGMEWGTGIPGTVGGAVRGNAGAMGKENANCLVKVKIWRDGEVFELDKTECGFGYRESIFKNNKDVILSAVYKLTPGDEKSIKEIMQTNLKQRTGRFPNLPSAGSFFKNIEVNKWSGKKEDLPEIFWERGKIPVGWLVEQVGMKGFTIGGAKISDEHGNFIINFSNAKQADILSLVETIKEKVYNKFGIELEPEVKIIN